MAAFFVSCRVFDVRGACSGLPHTTLHGQAKAGITCIVIHWSGFIIIGACSALSHSKMLINIGGGERMADPPEPSTRPRCGSHCLPASGLNTVLVLS